MRHVGHRFKDDHRSRSKCKISCLVVCLVAGCLIFFSPYKGAIEERINLHAYTKERLEHIRLENSLRPGKRWGRSAKESTVPTGWDDVLRVFDLLQGRPTLHTAEAIRERCSALSSLEQIHDSECTAEWIAHLAHGRVVGLVDCLSFGRGKKGAMRLQLDDGRVGFFKPCGTNTEPPENEIIAFHLSRLFKIGRVAPAVMRNITAADLRQWADQHEAGSMTHGLDIGIIEDIIETCAYDGGVLVGPMIGWVDGVEETSTIPKSFKRAPWLNETSAAEYRNVLDPAYAAEIVDDHYFYWMMGLLREVGYNEYKVGQSLIAIDLDRSHLDLEVERTHVTSCHLCRMKSSSFHSISRFPNSDLAVSLLVESLKQDPLRIEMHSMEKKRLKRRIANVRKCTSLCIEKYGLDDVLVD